MATESPIRILEGTEKWPALKQSTQYGPSSSKITFEDLGLFIKGQRFQSLEKDVIPSRSESAPPSMEGSIEAIENLFPKRKSTLNPSMVYPSISAINRESELQFHDDSSPSSYHNSAVVLDQRFRSHLNSRESYHLFETSGRTHSDRKMTPHAKSVDGSVGLSRNSLPAHEEESEDDGSSEQNTSLAFEKAVLLGYHSGSSDSRQESSLLDSSPTHDCYHSLSYKSMEEAVVYVAQPDPLKSLSISTSTAGKDVPSSDDRRQTSPLDGSRGIAVSQAVHERGLNAVNIDVQDNISTAGAHIEAGNSFDVTTARNSDTDKSLKKEQLVPQNSMLQHQTAPKESNHSRVQGSYSQMIYPGISNSYGSLNHFYYGSSSGSVTEGQPILQSSGFTPPFYAPAAAFMTSTSQFYPNLQPSCFFTPQYSMGGYAFNSAVLPSYLPGFPRQGAVPMAFDHAPFPTSGASDEGNLHAYNMQNLKFSNLLGDPLQPSFSDLFHMKFLQVPVTDLYGTYGHFGHQPPGDGAVVNQVGSCDLKKLADLGLLNDHKSQPSDGAGYNSSNLRGGNISSHYSFESPTNVGPLVQFPTPSAGSPEVPAKPVGGTYSHGGRHNMSHVHSGGNSRKTFGLQNQSWNDTNAYSILEELKLGKGQRFDLSDILGHIGDFSADQHGSRFIQQKLESCSVEEKASVFKEILPNASKLMTDVFGNYVIQKLFEYGSPKQRKDLANQLEGHILTLSLQMYGCRVIQKAVEVIDLEQKTRLVKELDGHVMRCVRDQNGNHVIQKCIENIPMDNIHFIIYSFRGQVATLSTHPYGCRVIQRVLERGKDESQTQFIVDEILDSVCSLAQDQYGNYVTQHVLERGKPRERSEIIKRLSGSIVQLSQHKFASNVIEKCLEYTDSTARGILIKEIIGDDGNKNDNLLVMMKDQYANYVIQRILQKCTSDQQEMLLGQIRNHIPVLKKYTYGKHIVARFEKLYGEEIQTSES